MRRYRVTFRRENPPIPDFVWPDHSRDFDRWWQAFRYARAMRGAGYVTTRVRVQ